MTLLSSRDKKVEKYPLGLGFMHRVRVYVSVRVRVYELGPVKSHSKAGGRIKLT